MSKKSKMKEREEASYIAPCEDVVVELPFMVKRVMRGRRPSNELCKQCMRVVFSTQYCHKGCAQEANQPQLPIIGRSERGTHVVFSST